MPAAALKNLLQFVCQHSAFFFIQKLPDLDSPPLESHRQAPRVPGDRCTLQHNPCPCAWAFPALLWLLAPLFHTDNLGTDSDHFTQLTARQATVKGNPQYNDLQTGKWQHRPVSKQCEKDTYAQTTQGNRRVNPYRSAP